MPQGKGPLRIAIEDFLLDKIFPDFMKSIVKGVAEFLEDEAREAFVNLIMSKIDKEDLPSDAKQLIASALLSNKPAALMAIVGAGFTIGAAVAGAFLAPVVDLVSQQLNPFITPKRLSAPDTLKAMWRGLSVSGDVRNELVKQGVSKDRIDILEEINRPRLPEAMLVALAFRFKSFRDNAQQELLERGWLPNDISLLFNAMEQRPSPQDLVTFNLRDVFNPQIVQKWGFREDLTEQFLDEMAKVGVPREYAEMYHMAGWTIPSPQLAYEMLHRLDGRSGRPRFTMDDLDNVLKAADYSPYARELLKSIAYQLPTRVDIRRMRELGVIDDATMHYYHLALGYDESVATQIDEFVLKDIADNGKNLTKENIIAGYENGIYSRPDALTELIELEYDESEAQFFLNLSDAQRARKLQDQQIELVEILYVENEIDRSQAHVRLDQINVASDRKEALFAEWDIKRKKREKKLSRSEIEDLYERGLMDENEVHVQVQKLGYAPDLAQDIILLIDARATEDKSRKLETAAKELDRLQRQDLRDELAILNADLDVKIKELQRDAADLKLAIHQIEDETLIAEMRDELAEIPPQIAQLQLEKAQARRSKLPPSQ